MKFINRINNNIILDIAIQVLPDSKKNSRNKTVYIVLNNINMYICSVKKIMNRHDY